MALEKYLHRKWVAGRNVLLDVKWSRTDVWLAHSEDHATIDLNSDSPFKGVRGFFGAGIY